MDLTAEICSHLFVWINNVVSAGGGGGGGKSNHLSSSSIFLSYLGNIALEVSQGKQIFQKEL